jgi:hypothetical protein
MALTLRHRISGAEITSKNFFSYFNILPSKLTMCEITRGEKENMLVLSMKTDMAMSEEERSQEA